MMFDRPTEDWIRASGAHKMSFGSAAFAVLPQYESPELTDMLRDFDRILEHSLILKDSRTTTAGIAAVADNGHPIFLKRTNSKGLRFLCRYLFRSARSFRSARAAFAFKNIGIRTPEIIAAGERRTGPGRLILRSGYLVTSTSDEIRSVTSVLTENVDPLPSVDAIFEYAAQVMSRLHGHHIVHGDLKLGNFYCVGHWSPDEHVCGVWDLDSVHFYAKPPPAKQIDRELGRLIASVLMTLDTHPAVPDSFFAPDRLAEQLVSLYEKEASSLPAENHRPDRAAVAALARDRWERMDGRKRREAGL